MMTYAQKFLRNWAMVGTLLVGLATTVTALAQQPGGGPGSPPPQKESLLTPEDRTAMRQIFMHRLQERLGLTDQQATNIQGLLQTQRAATQADVQSLIEARKQLRALLEEPTIDQTAIQNAANQVKTLQAKLFDGRLQTQLALRSKLTPEQFQKWLDLRRGMGQHGWRRGFGFGPGA